MDENEDECERVTGKQEATCELGWRRRCEGLALKLCFFVRSAMYASSRFPSFERREIESLLERSQVDDAEEAQILRAHNRSVNKFYATSLVLMYLLYALKNSVVPYKAHWLFDHENLNKKLHNTAGASLADANNRSNIEISSFACLATDCKRLRADEPAAGPAEPAEGLAHDLSQLPMFMLCHPTLNQIYTPVTSLDSFAMFAFVVSAFNVLLLGAWLPAQQMLSPKHDLMIMFISAPRTTRGILRQRARQLLVDIGVSLYNYTIATRERTLRDHGDLDRWPATGCSAASVPNVLQFKPLAITAAERAAVDTCQTSRRSIASRQRKLGLWNSAKCEECQEDNEVRKWDRGGERPLVGQSSTMMWPQGNFLTDKLTDSIVCRTILRDKTAGQFEQMVNNCLPLIRSYWWRTHVAVNFAWIIVWFGSFIICVGVGAFSYLQWRISNKVELLRAFAKHMRSNNCSLWTTDTTQHEGSSLIPIEAIIQLDQLDIRWNWYSLIETLGINFLPGMSITLVFSYYGVILCEIAVWLAEVRLNLLATLVVARFSLGENAHLTSEKMPPALRRTIKSQLEAKLSLHESGGFFKTSNLKRILKEETYFSCGFVLSSFSADGPATNSPNNANSASTTKTRYGFINSIRNDRRHQTFLVARALEQNQLASIRDTDYYHMSNIEMMEQIHVNFRLFVERIHQLTQITIILLSMSYLLNYGLLLIGTLYGQSSGLLNSEPIFSVCFGWSLSSFLIFLAANFHANVSATIKDKPV